MTLPEARSLEPEAQSPKPKVLMFDLGGVLIDWTGPRELGQYLRTPSTPEAIRKLWIECRDTEQFERGVLSPEEWAKRFVQNWDIALEPAEFLQVFRLMSRSLLPGARELLDSLRPRFRLAALSNSNELHWHRNTHELKVIPMFEFAISSHQVGLCKPDPAIFELAIERSAVVAGDIMYFDDLRANVDAARTLGIRACQAKGVEGVRTCLERGGLLSESP